MSETEPLHRRIISFIMDRSLEELRKSIRKELEELRNNIRKEIKAYTRLMVISFVGLTFIILGLFHLSLGIINQLSIYLGEALAFSILGLFCILLGIVMILLAMVYVKSDN